MVLPCLLIQIVVKPANRKGTEISGLLNFGYSILNEEKKISQTMISDQHGIPPTGSGINRVKIVSAVLFASLTIYAQSESGF